MGRLAPAPATRSTSALTMAAATRSIFEVRRSADNQVMDPAPVPRFGSSLAALPADPSVQRKCAGCAKEDEKVRRQVEEEDTEEREEEPEKEEEEETAVQPRLEVGPAGDAYEREADSIASRVMAMPAQGNVWASSASRGVQRACSDCGTQEELASVRRAPIEEPEEEEETVRARTEHPGLGMSIGAPPGRLTSGGRPLPDHTRVFFEERMGRDLSHVRVHDGAGSADLSRSIRARAFTYSNHIWLGSGENPQPSFTMAHELAHVLQQTRPPTSRAETNAGPSATRSTLNAPGPRIQRRQIFSSTLNICHRVLKSRVFNVNEDSVSAIVDADWIGPGDERCGSDTYPITLTEKGWLFDSERASCDFRTGRADIQTWTNVEPGEYYLTIWPNNTNPNCCLDGTIKVTEQTGVTGPSCGGRIREEKSFLDVLHLALDAAGMVPALGVVPDAVNAGIYLIEGDWANAGISAAAMVPVFGQGATATKWGVKITGEAVERLGREGIEQGLKKAARKEVAETAGQKTAGEATQRAAKQEASQETAEGAAKKKSKKRSKGKHTCFGRSFVLQIPSALPENPCPLADQRVDGPSVSAPSQAAACLAAKHAFNVMMPRGCKPKHLKCVCTKR